MVAKEAYFGPLWPAYMMRERPPIMIQNVMNMVVTCCLAFFLRADG